MSNTEIKPKHKRKLSNLIINPKYQLKYIFWLTFTGMSLVAINASIFYSYMKENYAILVDLSPMTDESKQQLYSELNHIVVTLMIASGIFLFLVLILGLVYSHRSAGPLYHFKRVFSEIRNGKTQARIKLRPNDDFQDVAVEFNKMMDTLNQIQK